MCEVGAWSGVCCALCGLDCGACCVDSIVLYDVAMMVLFLVHLVICVLILCAFAICCVIVHLFNRLGFDQAFLCSSVISSWDAVGLVARERLAKKTDAVL